MEPPPSPDPDPEDSLLSLVLSARPPRPCPDARVRVDAGDDAAVVGDGTVVTVDALVEGVHWNERLAPGDVGWKLLAASVADLAAMGARPDWALLTLALPSPDATWLAAFSAGLAEALATWDVRLVGGDTVRTSGPRLVSLTLGGRCVAEPILRSSALPGDDLWVTGTPGLADAGWRLARPPEAALAALKRPVPPLPFALHIAAAGLVHAALDLSDGLERDLPRLATASGVAALVEVAWLPSHPDLDGPSAWHHQVSGGEDHGLLFASPATARAALMAAAEAHGVRLTRIGRIEGGSGARLSDRPWPGTTFRHFSPGGPA